MTRLEGDLKLNQVSSEDKKPGGLNKLVFFLELPEDLRNLTLELARLNENLENLQEVLPQFKRLTEVLEDFRIMTAPLLGYQVLENPEEGASKNPASLSKNS